MPALPHLIAALVLATAAGTATAQAVHKCRAADGSTAYQDQPCAGETLPTPVLAPPPSDPWRPQPPVESTADTSGAVADPGPAPEPPPPLPRLYRCTRENGSDYISADGNPPARYVPAWVLGATSTRSNLPRDDARTRWDAAVGGAYVAWQDRCVLLGRAALCAHWRAEFAERRKDAGRTFFAEREAAEADVETLRAQLRTYCGG
jgi:hypothetical protein